MRGGDQAAPTADEAPTCRNRASACSGPEIWHAPRHGGTGPVRSSRLTAADGPVPSSRRMSRSARGSLRAQSRMPAPVGRPRAIRCPSLLPATGRT